MYNLSCYSKRNDHSLCISKRSWLEGEKKLAVAGVEKAIAFYISIPNLVTLSNFLIILVFLH